MCRLIGVIFVLRRMSRHTLIDTNLRQSQCNSPVEVMEEQGQCCVRKELNMVSDGEIIPAWVGG